MSAVKPRWWGRQGRVFLVEEIVRTSSRASKTGEREGDDDNLKEERGVRFDIIHLNWHLFGFLSAIIPWGDIYILTKRSSEYQSEMDNGV